ncbi:hypothetical protein AJ78_05091 [Emergomyces pasteurianus Ep9510]|uniref:X-Pro dipeptidyl-peptidase n=1 Tax=Emergomyces pasteurianus Ep9510 TaxID=1447872 RepID=A0A1J9QH91_9EURO|nr:hypothetical protein AJ78_05091 [Emergomyces pasteurianus Ep9510]
MRRQLEEVLTASTSDSDVVNKMQQRIERVTEDLKCLNAFYNISFSPERVNRLQEYYKEQLNDLSKEDFDSFTLQNKIDYLLLRNYLQRNVRQLDLDTQRDKKMQPLLPFAPTIINLCQERQKMKNVNGQRAASDLNDATRLISEIKQRIEAGKVTIEKSSALRGVKATDELRNHLQEWFDFFNGYDPLFTWWVSEPYGKIAKALEDLTPLIREKLVGIAPGDEGDAIVGEPIGREGLLADLEAEMIPYSPEELLSIGESEYTWCEAEMIKASTELGYGRNWHQALEYVKTLHVEPGQQTQLVHDLALEAIEYVTKHDLVTVPPLAAETWRMFMISPERQKQSPFFLGGEKIMVSYPTSDMDHESKLMSMRGNNIHFARATVFHELIPGHHLQMYVNARHRAYRQLFFTPFWIEGDALYWEMILWDKKFPATPENKIGMLFWRMHRCVRIIFSLNFHLGLMSAGECVNQLVERVGHERATAEGEVRRSFGGDYTPLYQAGYMLGALQLYALRKEVVDSGMMMPEKEFHDRILKENHMPIELLRALFKELPVEREFKANWRFYES